jgi:site-specific recombinase XerD
MSQSTSQSVDEQGSADQLIDRFLQDLADQETSPQTRRAYRFDLLHFADWFAQAEGERFTPESITPTDVREYRGYLLNVEKRQPSTVNRRLAALRRFFQWARGKGLAKELATDNVKGVASAPRAPHWLEKREVDRLTRTVERHGSTRDLAIVLTLRHTGIRVSELCSLQLSDVEISERKGSLTVRSGKGGKFRVLPLNLDARRAIASYLDVRPKAAADSIFVGQRGQGVSSRAVQLLITKYGRLAGLEDVTPHTLRHSFGKHALDAGADLVSVAALLGHQRLDTTAIYTTPSQRDLERVVARLEQDGDLSVTR